MGDPALAAAPPPSQEEEETTQGSSIPVSGVVSPGDSQRLEESSATAPATAKPRGRSKKRASLAATIGGPNSGDLHLPAVMTSPVKSMRSQSVRAPETSSSGPLSLARLEGQSATKSSAPPSLGVPPTVKRAAVQANAYHSTFVQAMITARGPEWKMAFRTAEKLTASEIAQCDFVWFKYEFIKGLPPIERTRLPADLIEKLRIRTAAYLNMQNENATLPSSWSGDVTFEVMRLLNAFATDEEEETPVKFDPLFNVERKRMPNMSLVQSSQAHIVGVPAMAEHALISCLQRLRPLLHYHHMRFAKGTPVIGCFHNASAVWRKHLLYRYMKQYCDNKPETRGSVRERMPISFTFDLNNPDHAEEATHFMQTIMAAQPSVVRWLAKATGGANGNGFYVTKDPVDMVRYVSSQPKKGGGEADFWVIQEFVERMPLLFDGHRFHMKVHVVMIASPVGIEVYAYKKQRIQCCSELYNPEVMHPLSYIGNWGQQRFATNLVQEKFSTLLEDIKGQYPLLLPAWHRAKQIIAEAIEAAWLCGREHFQFQPGCYELMGWDFVMEECPDGIWRPLLVEANHRPGFGSERKYMEKLIHETLELVMFPIAGMSKYQRETHLGDVEAIFDHVKTIVIAPSSSTSEGTASSSSANPTPRTGA